MLTSWWVVRSHISQDNLVVLLCKGSGNTASPQFDRPTEGECLPKMLGTGVWKIEALLYSPAVCLSGDQSNWILLYEQSLSFKHPFLLCFIDLLSTLLWEWWVGENISNEAAHHSLRFGTMVCCRHFKTCQHGAVHAGVFIYTSRACKPLPWVWSSDLILIYWMLTSLLTETNPTSPL